MAIAPRIAKDQHRHINQAFREARCLTGPGGRGHTWRRGSPWPRSDEDTMPLLSNPDPSFRSSLLTSRIKTIETRRASLPVRRLLGARRMPVNDSKPRAWGDFPSGSPLDRHHPGFDPLPAPCRLGSISAFDRGRGRMWWTLPDAHGRSTEGRMRGFRASPTGTHPTAVTVRDASPEGG